MYFMDIYLRASLEIKPADLNELPYFNKPKK